MGFLTWSDIIRRQYIKKFGPITDDLEHGREFTDLYKRFVAKYSVSREPFTVSMGEWAETSNVDLSIDWRLNPDDIPIIIQEFDRLVDDSWFE